MKGTRVYSVQLNFNTGVSHVRLKTLSFTKKNYSYFIKGCNEHLFNLQNYFFNSVMSNIKIYDEMSLNHRLLFQKNLKSIVDWTAFS